MKPMAAILVRPPQIYCGVADIVEEVLTVSGYCWDKINISRIENYQHWPPFSLKFACE